jgi:DNA (cytosine-5)-methyltransferase 1
MYGRLRWNLPAQTITSGYGSMGQGRYVHPGKRRTITPHEAARLQTIPDWFRFDSASTRTALARMIGNAVPPLLGAAIGRLVLSGLLATGGAVPGAAVPGASSQLRPAA